MKYAIMSDAHANPTALKKALSDARRHKCDKFMFLGDATGYGYDVKTTVELVRENFDVALMGNHDSACLGLEDADEVRANRNYDIDCVNRTELGAPNLRWLGERNYIYANADICCTHGDFIDPKEWGYILNPIHAWYSFAVCPARVMFCGHTHHLTTWELDQRGELRLPLDDERPGRIVKAQSVVLKLAHGSRYIINCGSVGYPRNDGFTSYAIFDAARNKVTLRRLPFDFAQYREKMSGKGLPIPGWLLRKSV